MCVERTARGSGRKSRSRSPTISESDSVSSYSHQSSTLSKANIEFTELAKKMRDFVARQHEPAQPSQPTAISPVGTASNHGNHGELLYMFREGLNYDSSSSLTLRVYHNSLTGAVFPLCQNSLNAVSVFNEYIKQSHKLTVQ